MKFLYFLFVITVAQATVIRYVRETKDLPAPGDLSLTTFDPPGFMLEWSPVENPDSSDPVLGYKVKVWEQPSTTSFYFEVVDGEKKLVDKEVLDKEFWTSTDVPTEKPYKDITLEGAKTTSVKVENVKVGRGYKTMVQAYTKSGEGPFSNLVGFMLQQSSKPKDTA